MCHLSMKLNDVSDPNPMQTSDKIVTKHMSVKETLFKLDLELKGQGQQKTKDNNLRNKIPLLN